MIDEIIKGMIGSDPEDFEEDDFSIEGMSQEEIFRNYLYIATELDKDNILIDIDDARDEFEARMDLLNEVVDAGEFESWKNKFLEEKYELIKDEKLIKAIYTIAGFGSYEEVVQEYNLDGFKRYINGMGAGHYVGEAEASKEDYMRFIARNALDI